MATGDFRKNPVYHIKPPCVYKQQQVYWNKKEQPKNLSWQLAKNVAHHGGTRRREKEKQPLAWAGAWTPCRMPHHVLSKGYPTPL